MNRYRLFALETALIFALTTQAQQATTTAGATAKSLSSGDDPGLPTVETQLKVLTEKLSLTSKQQDKIKRS